MLHFARSARAVLCNCSTRRSRAPPETMLESELFGYERDVFVGQLEEFALLLARVREPKS
jgi:transcriptional regulator with GAF, ATPase, and Fis domain